MRRLFICLPLVCWLALTLSAQAATGRVLKVLPLFLDSKGRSALSPSLYERDAYQAVLRLNPAQRSGVRYAVQWKTKGSAAEPLKLRVELRGVAQGSLPKQLALEQAVTATRWFGRWTDLVLSGDQYKNFGEVTAWRVTLWEGSQLLAEQRSFLW
jgi:hypothetical protein